MSQSSFCGEGRGRAASSHTVLMTIASLGKALDGRTVAATSIKAGTEKCLKGQLWYLAQPCRGHFAAGQTKIPCHPLILLHGWIPAVSAGCCWGLWHPQKPKVGHTWDFCMPSVCPKLSVGPGIASASLWHWWSWAGLPRGWLTMLLPPAEPSLTQAPCLNPPPLAKIAIPIYVISSNWSLDPQKGRLCYQGTGAGALTAATMALCSVLLGLQSAILPMSECTAAIN